MNLEDITLSEISFFQLPKDNTAWFHLDEAPKVVKFLESRMAVGGDRERGSVAVVSGLQDEKVLEIRCTIMCTQLTLMHCTVVWKMVKC